MMKNREYAWLALTAGFLGAVVGCSDKEGADGTDTPGVGGGASASTGSTSGSTGGSGVGNGNAAGGTTVLLSTGGNDGGAGAPPVSNGNQDGGAVALTEEQVKTIQQQACTGVSLEAENVPAILQLVVDVSLSMEDAAPGGGGTKWDVTRSALLAALDGIPASVAVGLQVYPNSEATLGEANPGCVTEAGRVPIAKLGAADSAQRGALAGELNTLQLLLGTPTHDAYTFALEGSLGPYEGAGNRFMLLITDGAPTQLLGCGVLDGDQAVETDPIIETMTVAASQGIRTFVIGSPGSEQGRAGDMREWLSQAALIGGTALEGCSLLGPAFCHFDMSQATDFSSALTEGLGAITSQVADSCTFAVPEASADETVDRNSTSVILRWGDGSADLILNDDAGGCTEGWTWSDEGEIVLCGTTCARAKLDEDASVTVSQGCDAGDIEGVIK